MYKEIIHLEDLPVAPCVITQKNAAAEGYSLKGVHIMYELYRISTTTLLQQCTTEKNR